jgi:hypothetical protein
MALTKLEKEKLARADEINALLSQSAIPEASMAAELRARQQQQDRLQRSDNRARQGNMDATLGVRQQQNKRDRDYRSGENQRDRDFRAEQNRLDNIAAQDRANTAASGKVADKANARAALADSVRQLSTLAGTVPEGEVGGFRQQVIKYGPEIVSDYARKGQSPEMEDLNTRGTLLQTQINKAFMSGVLSDQDMRMLGPLALKGDLNLKQINTISNTLIELLGGAAPDGQDSEPQMDPAVSKYLR